jgi:hemerythrin-like domain-containing protein
VKDGDQPSKPIAELLTEHGLIQKVVAGLSALETRMSGGVPMDAALLTRVVEFLREYADVLHHGKEEALLFPALERRGVPAHGCPVGALLAEHKRGRVLVTEFAEAIEAYASGADGAVAALAAKMRALAELYPAHIWKEDYLLFPMSEKVLLEDDLAELAKHFAEVNRVAGRAAIARAQDLSAELQAIVLQA